MIVDGIIELDDTEFADLEPAPGDIDVLLRLAAKGGAGSTEAMIDLCAAAADLAGGQYTDIEECWYTAYSDLQRILWSEIAGTGVNDPARQWATDTFRERVRFAIARFDDSISDEENDDMGTATATKRSREKSVQQATEKVIQLRLEKRLKFSGSITIREQAAGEWVAAVAARDSKLSRDFDQPVIDGAYESEVIFLAFRFLLESVDSLIRDSVGHAVRLAAVKGQLQTQLQQVSPGAMDPQDFDLPETQAEAAAKEAAASPGMGTMVPNNRPAWKCTCGEWNDVLEVEQCRCGEKRPESSVDSGDLESLRIVEVVEIDPDLLVDHPHQPRGNYVGIDELGESMARNGQLDDAWGRRLPDGRVELIRGHRRKRAALSKGLQLRVKIVDCDDAKALELIGVDDANWEAFDAIARARWYKSMLDTLGISQRDLATRIGKSQADIANHIRMLSLPDDWIQRVITQEITPTMARSLAPWSERPAVLSAMAEELDEWLSRDDGPMTSREFDAELRRTLRGLSLPCTKGDYYSGDYPQGKKSQWKSGTCHLTEAEIEQYREELDILEVPSTRHDRETEPRAFNLKRWFELNAAAEKRSEAKASQKNAPKGAKSGSGKKAEPTAAEVAARKKQQDQQLKVKLERYLVRWLQARVQKILADSPDQSRVFQLFLFFSARSCGNWSMQHSRAEDVRTSMSELKGSKAKGKKSDGWAMFSALNDAACWQVVSGSVLRWFGHDPFDPYSDLRPDDVIAIATDWGVDLEKEWRVEQEFLELFTKDQLATLYREWKLMKLCSDDKRESLMKDILTHDKNRRLPVPKCLK